MKNILLAFASKTLKEYDKLHAMKNSGEPTGVECVYDRWIVIPKKGLLNAINRLFRRQWVKDGYLKDAQWIFDNIKVSTKTKQYALANLERNGWTFAHEMHEDAI